MATHSSVLAWRIPWTKEPCRLQSRGSQRVGHSEHTHRGHCPECEASSQLSATPSFFHEKELQKEKINPSKEDILLWFLVSCLAC